MMPHPEISNSMGEKKWKLAIVHGPNLNLIGERNPDVYGKEPFEPWLNSWEAMFPELEFSYFQSNIEGEIIDYIQSIRHQASAMVLNAGAYTHTSIALGDCLESLSFPIIEVHISHVYARERFRRESRIAPYVLGSISGLGLKGYEWAIRHLVSVLER